jgi:isopentenyl-diphosphate delta-isomerase
MDQRKKDHLQLVECAQMPLHLLDDRFDYEPLLGHHRIDHIDLSKTFLGKTLQAPLWISSMTGGTADAKVLNQRLARTAKNFALGMGVGSCRAFLENPKDASLREQFCLRPLLGDKAIFFANLGIAQVAELVLKKDINPLKMLVEELEADGLIIHVNPLQEYVQAEGDRFLLSPLQILEELLGDLDYPYPLIIKEVGQGMGPRSLEALMKLPLAAIDFAAFGGTNFSQIEALRSQGGQVGKECLARLGHGAEEMMRVFNALKESLRAAGTLKCSQEIISGGISHFLDMHYYRLNSDGNALLGQGRELLLRAKESQESLDSFVESQIEGLKIASQFLFLKDKDRKP